MTLLRAVVTPADYVQDAELSALFGEPTYVLRHDPYACPGNPCSDPQEGAQAYNLHQGSRTPRERLSGLLRRAQDDLGLSRLLVQLHDAEDGNACLRLAIEAGEGGLFHLREEILGLPSSTYLALRNRVMEAEGPR